MHDSAIALPLPDSVKLTVNGASRKLRKQPWHFYKGVPWKSQVVYNSDGTINEVLFHAPLFCEYLFFRLVLLPLLWRLAVIHGGFYLLGTACLTNDDITQVLFARPGAGKTSYVLKQLHEQTVQLLGDGSLLYLPEEGFMPVIDEVELRWKTIAGTPWQNKLALKKQLQLRFYHLISCLTRRFISLNISVLSKELGIEKRREEKRREEICIYTVHPGPMVAKLSKEAVEENIMLYLNNYHQIYQNIFTDSPPLTESQQNIKIFCTKYLE